MKFTATFCDKYSYYKNKLVNYNAAVNISVNVFCGHSSNKF